MPVTDRFQIEAIKVTFPSPIFDFSVQLRVSIFKVLILHYMGQKRLTFIQRFQQGFLPNDLMTIIAYFKVSVQVQSGLKSVSELPILW